MCYHLRHKHRRPTRPVLCGYLAASGRTCPPTGGGQQGRGTELWRHLAGQPRLRQEHGAEFAGADQADRHRAARGLTFKQERMQVHSALSSPSPGGNYIPDVPKAYGPSVTGQADQLIRATVEKDLLISL